jgi:aspartyl-tRNA(Asn)/glutamyl-tRNA(Gln) amidotransferase subunit A
MKPWLDDACSLAEAIKLKEVKVADVLDATLESISHSRLNAVAHLDTEGARRRAEQLDAELQAGRDIGPFGGVPVLIKDNQDVAGMPTTHGSIPYKDNIADKDSTIAARLRAAGAVLIGKSTMSEFGFVAYTSTKLFGTTRNPWALDRTPAGSSGGAAAAVAGGLVPIASGGDGGGSIRLPAAFCGLVGMKGTFGRVPRGPGATMGPLTMVPGALARTVRDATRFFDVVSGYDPRDPLSLPRIDGWEAALGQRSLKGIRAAYSADLGNAIVHPEVERVARDAAEQLVESARLQRTDAEIRVPENGIAWARAGLPSLINELRDYWPGCKEDLTFEIRAGREFAPDYRAWHAASVDRFRVEMNEALADIFEQVDILLCPVSPLEPFPAEGPMPRYVGETKVNPYNAGALTIPANISGYPAISIPAGLSASGLPIGLQAYARRHEDALLLELALILERERPWPQVAPEAPV